MPASPSSARTSASAKCSGDRSQSSRLMNDAPGLVDREHDRRARIDAANRFDREHGQPQPLLLAMLELVVQVQSGRALPELHLAAIVIDHGFAGARRRRSESSRRRPRPTGTSSRAATSLSICNSGPPQTFRSMGAAPLDLLVAEDQSRFALAGSISRHVSGTMPVLKVETSWLVTWAQ